MVGPKMRRRIILDVTVEDFDSNREVDLLDVTSEAVLDALDGYPAVDMTEEFPCVGCGDDIELERMDDGQPWDNFCGACADQLALPDDSTMRSDGSPRVWS